MTQPSFNQVPDSGAQRVLEGGLVIIRRMKHEWRDELQAMAADRLTVRTGKKWGSKFLVSWTPDRLADWISTHVANRGWIRQNEPFPPLDVWCDEPVGLADGQKVHTIRIVCDGHYVHAYPIKD